MSKVMIVDFEGHQIRSIKIDGEVWFVAKDVVEALGKGWSGQALDTIPDEWLTNDKIITHETTGRDVKREVLLMNEQAFHRIIGRSDHPRAIKFSNKVAQFLKDVRQGNIGQEELDKMQGDVQMFFSFFSTILPQRKVNYKRNRTPKLEDGNASFWNKGHELIGGKSCRERKAELIKRGAPAPLVNRSGLDGLRWFKDTYWESIPHWP